MTSRFETWSPTLSEWDDMAMALHRLAARSRAYSGEPETKPSNERETIAPTDIDPQKEQ